MKIRNHPRLRNARFYHPICNLPWIVTDNRSQLHRTNIIAFHLCRYGSQLYQLSTSSERKFLRHWSPFFAMALNNYGSHTLWIFNNTSNASSTGFFNCTGKQLRQRMNHSSLNWDKLMWHTSNWDEEWTSYIHNLWCLDTTWTQQGHGMDMAGLWILHEKSEVLNPIWHDTLHIWSIHIL